ncbi:MAG: SDR family oxidoreductase [Pseudomonadota bacterium]|nr:SDR family oxidoreductase [Pseudomonadota bacterium]
MNNTNAESISAERPILITGCSSGIGYCLAHGLQARGFPVFASCRKVADVKRLRHEGLECLRLDLDSTASIEAAVADVLARTGGRLYGLVNNGAYGQPGAVEDLSREVLRAQFETNLFGTHELTTRVLPTMRAAGEGRIVQISSILGLLCLRYRGAYNASKYALEALSDTLRLELRGSGIEVSLIEPGPIRSDFRRNAWRHFEAFIDQASSPHRGYYAAVEKRLQSLDDAAFTLAPEAVLKCARHALESRRPKVRYPVTLPTRVLPPMKRLLPDRWMDRLLAKIG